MKITDELWKMLLEYGPKILGAILVLVIGFYLTTLIINIVGKALDKSKLNISLHSFIKSIINFLLKAIIIITALNLIGIPMTTFIAVLSAAGLAVGLALKDSLSNFAGGVLILSFNYFNVGDFIEAQGYMGTVKEIKLLYTVINSPDNKRIIIPNGELSNAKITNFSYEKTRRVDMMFGISYDNDIAFSKSVLEKVVNNHPLILGEPLPVIRVSKHSESSIDFDVKVWCNSENYWAVYYDLNEQVKMAFDENNILIPFPQIDVHLNN